MSSGITFSGFNDIDFNTVISALMKQAAEPLATLQSRQTALKTQISTFNTLSSRIYNVQNAAEDLSAASDLTGFSTSVSDSTLLKASAGASAIPGHYDVVVNELARAQVTATKSFSPDPDSTIVASSGALTINGKVIAITAPVTLQGLAKAINETDGIGATASVVQVGAANYRLVLTAIATGQTNGFTLQNALVGGAPEAAVTFEDTDGDGTTGDDAADNAVQATDASLTVNNIAITSSSNNVTTAIPGTTLNLLRKSPGTTIGVDITEDSSGLQKKLETFIDAYNALTKFVSDQGTAAVANAPGNIGRDPLTRQLRSTVRQALTSAYGSDEMKYLSQIGVEFTRTGTMQLNVSKFRAAVADGPDAFQRVLTGTDSEPGVFDAVESLLTKFTESAGYISQAQQRLTKQIAGIDDQIAQMQRRLDIQRAALVKEYTAADLAMNKLKTQSSALSTFSTNISQKD